ncbi:MAG: hypothetical protein AB8G16_14825 [Gammaproteobacteria bacterium]
MYRKIILVTVLLLSPLAHAAEITPKQQKQLTKSAQAIVTALEKRDFPAFQRMVDSKVVLANAVDRPGLSAEDRKAALTAMKTTLPAIIRMSARFNGMTDFKLTHIATSDTGAVVTVQGQTEGRTSYWEFHLVEGRRGKFKIVNWLGFDIGVPLTDVLLAGFADDAQNVNAMAAVLSAPVADEDRPALEKQLRLLAGIWQGQDEFNAYVAAHYELPDTLQKERLMLRHLTIQAQVADANEVYFYALEQLEKHHSDDWRECELLLIHYEHVGDQEGTQRCTDEFAHRFGGAH